MMDTEFEEQGQLILAAEDCEPQQFSRLHKFSPHDDRIIAKLMAHGPVLLRGGRGCGKSALMIEASRRLEPIDGAYPACGIYVSLRHLTLLKAKKDAYEAFLCELVLNSLQKKLGGAIDLGGLSHTVKSLQKVLAEASAALGKRIVIFFDDAAHIGRESSLEEFFDTFRTISSSTVSCKAAIYPGVTKYGIRFDVLNDATVIDVSRSDELPGFPQMFADVMTARYPNVLGDTAFSTQLPRLEIACFLGRAVLGNMRTFVFACNKLQELRTEHPIGLTDLNETLLHLATNHYWALLDELKPKLGMYEPMIEPAREIAESVFTKCAKDNANRFAAVNREITERLAKPFEMLEYVGFIAKRDVSRALKSGGRGARYVLNLCTLLEKTPGTRLTRELFDRWSQRTDPIEFNRGSDIHKMTIPNPKENCELGILAMPIETLKQSYAYPYGLTPNKIEVLKATGINTVGDLADKTDAELDAIRTVGEATVRRFQNVLGQAIWM